MKMKYKVFMCGLFGLCNVILIVICGIVVLNINFDEYGSWVGDIFMRD